MRINNNLSALTAYNALNKTGSALQKSIQQLSTGLRINSASDDSAGLAISERIRAQTAGLDMAVRNAQDGMSMLQTAEGAIESTTSILQRMRALAVQASNDTLTAQDRNFIQLEIDELRDEVDRIARTTQFNGKRLLDGSAGASWSSSDLNARALIRGGLTTVDQFGQRVSAEGNYNIDISAIETGAAQVQKSNIINVIGMGRTTALYEININDGVDSLGAASGDGWSFDPNEGTLTITASGTYSIVGTGEATTNKIVVASSAADAKIFLTDVNIDLLGDPTDAPNSSSSTWWKNYFNLNECAFQIENGASADIYLAGTNTLKSGFHHAGLEVAEGATLILSNTLGDDSAAGELTVEGGCDAAGIGGGNGENGGTITINGGSIIAKAGRCSAAIGGGEYCDGGTITINGGMVKATPNTVSFINGEVTFGSGAGIGGGSYGGDTGTVTINGGTVYAEGGDNYGAGIGSSTSRTRGTITINGGTVTAQGSTAAGIGGGVDSDGGTIIINGGTVTANGGSMSAGIGGSRQGNGGTITITGGNIIAQGGASAAGIGGGDRLTQNFTRGADSGTIRIKDDLIASGAVTATAGAGGDAEDIGHGNGGTNQTVILNDTTLVTPAPPVIASHPAPDRPTHTTERSVEKMLSEISQFYDASGAFMVEEPQTITITQGDGRTADVTLYAHDTMYDVAQKINDAIADGLGQRRYVDNSGKFCTIADGTETTSESVCTKEPIYSDEIYKRDENGEYVLDDDGNRIVLSQEERLTGYAVNATMLVRSAIPGKAGELSFSGDENILNALGLNTIQQSSESRFSVSVTDAHTGATVASAVKVTGNQANGVIHPNVDVEFDAMSGIKAAWDEETKRYILAGSGTRTATLHLVNNSTVFQVGANKGEELYIDIGDMSADALGITRVNVAARERAQDAIDILDTAINRVSAQRAKIGAYQNSLEYTAENLTTTLTNLTAADSRIRDADMAETMMEFVKLQILNQSGTSMLAQANQLPQSVLSLIGG